MNSYTLRILCAVLLVAMIACACLVPWISVKGYYGDDGDIQAVSLYETVPDTAEMTLDWFDMDEYSKELIDESYEELIGVPFIVLLIAYWLCVVCTSVALLLSLVWIILCLCNKKFRGWSVPILWALAAGMPVLLLLTEMYSLGGGLLIALGLSLIASALSIMAAKKDTVKRTETPAPEAEMKPSYPQYYQAQTQYQQPVCQPPVQQPQYEAPAQPQYQPAWEAPVQPDPVCQPPAQEEAVCQPPVVTDYDITVGNKDYRPPVREMPVEEAPVQETAVQEEARPAQSEAELTEQTPMPTEPLQEQYEAPVQESLFEAPAAQQYEAPAQPQYEAPAVPRYEAPAQPQYQQQYYPQQQQQYYQPQQPYYPQQQQQYYQPQQQYYPQQQQQYYQPQQQYYPQQQQQYYQPQQPYYPQQQQQYYQPQQQYYPQQQQQYYQPQQPYYPPQQPNNEP